MLTYLRRYRLAKWAVVLLGCWGALVALECVRAGTATDRGLGELARARAALGRGDQSGARSALAAASASFRDAERRLSSPVLAPLRPVPFVGGSIESARSIVGVGKAVTHSADSVVQDVALEQLLPREGRFPVEQYQAAGDRVAAVHREFAAGIKSIQSGRSDVVWPISAARTAALTSLDKLGTDLSRVSTGLAVAYSLLGEHFGRRILVLFENNAETRATGGLIGSWALIRVDAGSVSLERVDRVNAISAQLSDAPSPTGSSDTFESLLDQFDGRHLIQNANMVPDFPTVAAAILARFNSTSFPDADAVVSVDNAAFPSLLTATGPIDLGSEGVVDASNVIARTGVEAYERLKSGGPREEFLARVVNSVWERFFHLDEAAIRRTVRPLGTALRGGHIKAFSLFPDEQEAFRSLQLAGAYPDSNGWGVGWTTQNVAANKMDLFLQRSVAVKIGLSRASGRRSYGMDVTITLKNPPLPPNLPPYVTGPYQPDGDLRAGDNRQLVTVYSSAALESAEVDGRRQPVASRTMGGWQAHTAGFVTIRSGSSATVRFRLTGVVAPGINCLDLPLVPQVAAQPDRISLSVIDGQKVLLERVTELRGTASLAVPLEPGGCGAD